MFDFNRGSLSPTPSLFSRHFLEEVGGDRIPTAEGFDDEGLEENTLRATVFKVSPILCRFPCFDGSSGSFGSTE